MSVARLSLVWVTNTITTNLLGPIIVCRMFNASVRHVQIAGCVLKSYIGDILSENMMRLVVLTAHAALVPVLNGGDVDYRKGL